MDPAPVADHPDSVAALDPDGGSRPTSTLTEATPDDGARDGRLVDVTQGGSGGCPVPHGNRAGAPSAAAPPVDVAEVTTAIPTTSAVPGCPVPHVAAATAPGCPIPRVVAATPGCPVMHGPGGVRRSPADLVVRRLLRIPERPTGLSDRAVYTAFQRSMLISAIRCTLTYVVFPFVLPTLHFLKGGAPVIGVLVGAFALVCDVFTIRRFFAVDHKYRWHFSTIAFAIMGLVTVLVARDLADIARSLFG